jgi:transcriptional regulator GlxA family with amidase domain
LVLRRVGFLGFEQAMALDLIGPSEAFAAASASGAEPGYEILILGATGRTFRTESGVLMKPHLPLNRAPALDTLFIPGGAGLREEKLNAQVCAWIKRRAPAIRRIAAVCTGIYGLAPTGLLDGRRVTTHWRFAQDVAERFPALKLDPNAIYLKDGPFYTSAGVTAGIDLALALIEEDHGPRLALSIARELVVYLRRSGGQEQYSEPLQFQTAASDGFGELAAWMMGHLDRDLSVEALAQRAHLSPRQFTRRFKSAFACTPAAFVESMRLDEARRRLSMKSSSVGAVAESVGFTSADAFRRAFQRRFAIAPSNYRERFGARRRK